MSVIRGKKNKLWRRRKEQIRVLKLIE